MRWLNKAVLPTTDMEGADCGPITDVSTGEDKRFTIAALASYIIHFYTSRLGGTDRTVKSAIDTIVDNQRQYDGRIRSNTERINNIDTEISGINTSIDDINSSLNDGSLTNFKAGDTFVMNNNMSAAGFVMQSATTFSFLIPMPKNPVGLTASIQFDATNAINLYGVNGLIGSRNMTPSRFSNVYLYTKTNGVSISLTTSSVLTNAVADTPITAVIRGTITFS